MKKIIFFFAAIPSLLNAQIDGANVFGTDQVLTVNLTFSQNGFWDSLVANYATETWMMGDVTITDITGTYSYPSVGVRLKGNSTYGHPGNKKSFKIDFNEYVSGQAYDGLKKLNFNNCFKDPSFMREKIFFDMCQDIGIPAPRCNYANVYMNGTFWGFYDIVEQVDDQFLDWAILEDSGNLFKAGDNFQGGGAAADLKYYGTDTSLYTSRYELKTNETANDWTDLIALIDFINNTTDQDFANNFEAYFNRTELMQSIAMDNLFSNLDSYLNSARNYYLYHNMVTNKWEWIKWDANETFGSYTGGPGAGNMEQMSVNYIAADRPLVSRIFNDTWLNVYYKRELCDIMENHFNSANVSPRIDELKTLIAQHVYNDVNKQYTNANFDAVLEGNITVSGGGPGGGGQTVYGLKTFIANRYNYLQSVVDCASIGLEENANDQINLFPNPFSTSFRIQGISGNEEITMVNALGQSVEFKLCKEGNAYVLEPMGVAGVYFVQIGEQVRKMLKR